MVEALVVLLVVGSVGVLGTALLVRPARPDEVDDQPRVMHTLPPVPPPARRPMPLRPLPPPPRPARRCGHCRAAGHTRALCPRLTGIQMLPGLIRSTAGQPVPGPPPLRPAAGRQAVGHPLGAGPSIASERRAIVGRMPTSSATPGGEGSSGRLRAGAFG